MTSNELRILAQTKSGLSISEPMGLELVKEAIDILSLEYYLIGKLTVEELHAESNIPAELSNRPLKIVSVKDSIGYVSANTDYEIDDNSILFNAEGDYVVRYYAEPIKPKVATDDLDIPREYHNCIAYYIASVTRARLFGQDDSNAVSFYQQFADGALKANNAYLRKKGSGKRIPPRR